MYSVSGKVLRGLGYGRVLGFPTANISRHDYSRQKLHLREGVYAGTAKIISSGAQYKAGIVVGPMDRRGLPKIEAHLLDFSGVLYGKKLKLSFIFFIRPFKKFASEKGLKGQIANDLKLVRKKIRL